MPAVGSNGLILIKAVCSSTGRGMVAVSHNDLPTGERGRSPDALMKFYTTQHQ
jgi:hypothetical protein